MLPECAIAYFFQKKTGEKKGGDQEKKRKEKMLYLIILLFMLLLHLASAQFTSIWTWSETTSQITLTSQGIQVYSGPPPTTTAIPGQWTVLGLQTATYMWPAASVEKSALLGQLAITMTNMTNTLSPQTGGTYQQISTVCLI